MNEPPFPPKILPEPGQLRALAPQMVERLHHHKPLTAVALDHLGRLSIALNGDAVRATLTVEQLTEIGFALLAAADELEARAAATAARAEARLAEIVDAQGSNNAH
jgi:hypothetical protein